MHPLTPLGDPERCAASVTVLAAAAAPRRASRAVRPGEKRRRCVPSARAAECWWSGVGCSLTPSRTQLLCHRRGGAKSRTGLRRADSPPATPPPLASVFSDPKESGCVCVCANASEQGGETESTPGGGRWSFGRTAGEGSFHRDRPPRRALGGGPRGGALGRSPAIAFPTPASALARKKKN